MEIVGADPKIIETIKQIGLLSRSRFPVVIEGESGTGKELVARALHDATSPGAPFVALNCSAVVPTLFESELFGHEKGAFTGAEAMKVGKLERAGEGTIFFDKVGDMSGDLQAKLVRPKSRGVPIRDTLSHRSSPGVHPAIISLGAYPLPAPESPC